MRRGHITVSKIKKKTCTIKNKHKQLWKISTMKTGRYKRKQLKETFRRCKDLPCSCAGRTNIVKMAIVLKAIYRFNKTPSNFNTINRHTETILKFMQQHKIPWISKQILAEQCQRYHTEHLSSNYNTNHSDKKTAGCLYNNRSSNQWDAIEDQGLNAHP